MAAQNYVPNPSFEDMPGCVTFNGGSPANPDQFVSVMPPWSSYGQSPDMFGSCMLNSAVQLLTGNNYWGHQAPFDGLRYIGFGYSLPSFFEYTGCPLLQPLTVGDTFEVSCWVSLSDHFVCASNSIGMLFLNQSYASNGNPMPFPNRCSICTDSAITDSLGWTQIKGTFIADSSYSNLAIGFMKPYTITVNAVPNSYFYYYVDYVCVVPLGGLCDVPLSVGVVGAQASGGGGLTVFPNPVVKSYSNILYLNKEVPIEVFDIMGRLVLSQAIKKEIDMGNLNAGTYFIRDKEGHSAKVVIME
jgi:hypothetical protein